MGALSHCQPHISPSASAWNKHEKTHITLKTLNPKLPAVPPRGPPPPPSGRAQQTGGAPRSVGETRGFPALGSKSPKEEWPTRYCGRHLGALLLLSLLRLLGAPLCTVQQPCSRYVYSGFLGLWACQWPLGVGV